MFVFVLNNTFKELKKSKHQTIFESNTKNWSKKKREPKSNRNKRREKQSLLMRV